VMNDEMDDFSVQPGVPNAFGLMGGEANAIAPGKRPLSSMSPTIVSRMACRSLRWALRRPKIINAVLQELVDMLDLGMTPSKALAAPRIHQQWSPDEMIVEAKLPARLKKSLEQRGHKLREINAAAVSQNRARSADGKTFIWRGRSGARRYGGGLVICKRMTAKNIIIYSTLAIGLVCAAGCGSPQ